MMTSLVRTAALAAATCALLSCSSKAEGTGSPTGSTGNTSSTKKMTATYGGVDYKPTLLTSAYLSGQVSVNASDGPRNFSVNAINVNALGTYSVASGNANSALAQWIDANTGTYSSIGVNAGGTVTFTTLQLGRVAGSFDITVRNTATGNTTTLRLVGTFDIAFP